MWTQLQQAWGRIVCRHDGPIRVCQLGRALPGNDNPVYKICLNCGAVKLENSNHG